MSKTTNPNLLYINRVIKSCKTLEHFRSVNNWILNLATLNVIDYEDYITGCSVIHKRIKDNNLTGDL